MTGEEYDYLAPANAADDRPSLTGETPTLCLTCGREMSTEEAIRSDFCPACDVEVSRARA